MALSDRAADLQAAIAALKALVVACDGDLVTAVDPDASAIARIREQAMSALGSLGLSSGEPQ